MAYRTIQSNFTGGLLSPLSTGLVGTDLYNKGLEMAENCFYGPSGGVYKRNGTKIMAYISYGDNPETRGYKLFHTVINETDYVFMFYTATIKIFISPGADEDDTGTEGVLLDFGPVKWGCKHPEELSVAAQNGVVYIVGAEIAPLKIYFTGDITAGTRSFRAETVTFVTAQEGTETEGSVKTTVHTPVKPATQAFYDGRWFLAGDTDGKLTVWASRPYDAVNGVYRYNDFTTSYSVYSESTASWQAVDLADLAVSYTFDNDNGASCVQWLCSHNNGLTAGTDGGIYYSSQTSVTSSTDNALTFSKQSAYGAAPNLVVTMGNYLLFVSADRRRVIALAYSQQYNSLAGGNISEVIEHHFVRNSKITAIAATDGPVPHLYVLVSGQGVFVCQFDPLNNIVAWSKIVQYLRLSLGLCSISGTNRGTPALALFNCKFIDSTTPATYSNCSLELLEEVSAGSVWQYPSIDRYRRLSPGGPVTISPGYKHTAETTCIFRRNPNYKNTIEGYQSDSVPMAFDITYPAEAVNKTFQRPATTEETEDWYIGDIYSFAILIPRSELPANGTSQGTERAVKKVTLRLFNSYGGVVFLFPGFESGMIKSPNLGDVENNLTYDYGPTYRKPNNYAKQALYKIFDKDVFNGWQGLFTGDKAINFITPTVEDDRIAIVQNDPMPFAICAVIVDRAVKEG